MGSCELESTGIRTGTGNWLLSTQYCMFGLHKSQEIS
jgi:hypothetical protein